MHKARSVQRPHPRLGDGDVVFKEVGLPSHAPLPMTQSNADDLDRAPWADRERFGSPSSASSLSVISTIDARVDGVNQLGRVANNRSSVDVLPLAPGAKGQPPRPPSEPSTIVAPAVDRGERVGHAESPRVVAVEDDAALRSPVAKAVDQVGHLSGNGLADGVTDDDVCCACRAWV